ncbi:hypothetical protein EDB85DRAFT_2153683 [Lactarius pseudohatsudake]|nr:hypothetical protein EDB85DRAFT_2153683 [Lactarius pseudohatsudake]
MLSVGINIVSQLLRILADIGLKIVVGLVARAIYIHITTNRTTGGRATDRVGGQPGLFFPNSPDGFHHSPSRHCDRPALYWRQELKTEVFNNRYNTQTGWAPVAPNALSMTPLPVYPGIVDEE